MVEQLNTQQNGFAELQHAEFQESRFSGFMSVRANTLLLVAGLVVATTVGNYLESAFPKVGKYGTLIAGVLMVILGRKSTILKSIGMGIFLAGVAEVVKSFDMISKHFAEEPFAEVRETYGGVAGGVTVTSPDRRTVV